MHDRLQQLYTKIQSVLGLLRIDEKKEIVTKLEQEMQMPSFWEDQERARKVSTQHESLKTQIDFWKGMYDEVISLMEFAKALDDAPDDLLAKEIEERGVSLEKTYASSEFYVLMDGKYDDHAAIVSLYAGSGGTEAQDWTEMLLRMITRFCEKKGWMVTLLDETRGTEAGIKSVMLRVEGSYVYGHLKSEQGTHRLVRISPFDAEGMRHTSFANIEVIPEIDHDELVIDPKDLRIDTFMSGGNGGQSVNTTYSAVRIVHIPTGITVSCQNEKSQQQNKIMAMRVLQSRLQLKKDEEEEKERQAIRGEVKAAEWGSQIRSYVLHPYKMVKDIRTRYEVSDPDAVLDGDLQGFVEAYLRWKKEKQVS
ncbi:MAG: peptide chain release factor 2 [Candidatus Magasanikbacteria bacterium]|nr:peptide chain release factor 2 [Candidatus Magasanikbacteria bacterium]NCS72419.1 peptide chain release factor 2 [Candidatus Magasanikbacteria bacterium]